ncbi:tetratricopeptide repeat protein [Microcoleus vaginatus]
MHSPISTKRRRINPNYAEAYNNRGIARSQLGDKKGAVADFNQAPAN